MKPTLRIRDFCHIEQGLLACIRQDFSILRAAQLFHSDVVRHRREILRSRICTLRKARALQFRSAFYERKAGLAIAREIARRHAKLVMAA